MAKKTVHIVPYTHWDREYQWEFERTRMRLVDCIDHLLDLMEEEPEFKSFLLDGQFSLIEDYLEIRPERKDALVQLVKEGRLEIGPWYTLPDCVPVHCETVVRNLMYGFRKSEDFGGAMRVGYSVYSFGQIAQMPQIYAHFGIDTVLFHKNVDPSRTKYHEFIWEAPDGTRALATRLGPLARWNFFYEGHIPIVYDREPEHTDWQYRWGDGLGKVFHTANPDDYGWCYEILDPEASFHPMRIKEAMARALQTTEGTACPEDVLLFDGIDGAEPHPLTPQIYAEIQRQYVDELDIVHGTLTEYVAKLKASLAGREDLDVLEGAMRDGPTGAAHGDIMTVHPEILNASGLAEKALMQYAERLSALAWLQGIAEYPTTYLDKAWKLLFQSQAHDSLHGLGPATLVEGQLARLDQVCATSRGLEHRALQSITKEINTSKIKSAEFFLAVFNTTSFERTEIAEAYVDLPADVRLDYLIIEDMDGKRMPVQEMERIEGHAGVRHPHSRNMPYHSTKAHLFFLAAGIPAMGYKTYTLKWAVKPDSSHSHEEWESPRIPADSLLTGPYQAENEVVRLSINPDGTFDVMDKETHCLYRNLNYFMDEAETGSMWVSKTPANCQRVYSLGKPADISVAFQGPLAAAFDIRTALCLPAEYDGRTNQRSEYRKEMPISLRVTIWKTSPLVGVELKVDNTIKDHYLRICFPTEIKSERTWAEEGFTVTNYPVKPSRDGELRGKELARHPAQLWFDLWDGERGLAILTETAKDYEIAEHDIPGVMAMGILRGVRLRFPCDEHIQMEYPGDESAQALGMHTLRYAVMPHSQRWDHAGLSRRAQTYRVPVRVCQFGRQEGALPVKKSFLAIEDANLILAAFKKAEDRDSIIVRFVNATGAEKTVKLKVGFPVEEAYEASLNEERLKPLPCENGEVSVTAGKGKIMTIEFVPAREAN